MVLVRGLHFFTISTFSRIAITSDNSVSNSLSDE